MVIAGVVRAFGQSRIAHSGWRFGNVEDRQIGMSPTIEEHKSEIVGAYTAAIRLRLYARLAVLLGALGVVAAFGAMVVGWLGVSAGVVAMVTAALVAVATGGKLYDQSWRTSISAAGLERSVSSDEDLYESVPAAAQRLKTVSGVVVLVIAVAAAGILGYSFQKAGTETDDDDDDRTSVSRQDDDKDDKDDKDDNGNDD